MRAGDKRWNEFKNEVRKHANPEDNYTLIEWRKFQEILKRVLNIKLTINEKRLFVDVCGKTVLSVIYIDVSYIESVKFN